MFAMLHPIFNAIRILMVLKKYNHFTAGGGRYGDVCVCIADSLY